MANIDTANLETLIPKISNSVKLSEASIRNLLDFQPDMEIAKRLDVLYADLGCIFSGEKNHHIAQLFDLTEADIDNLIIRHGRAFVVGMILAKLLQVKR